MQGMAYPSRDQLLNEARETTGLSDFGGESFHQGFDHLLASLERDARLPPNGQHQALAVIRRRLVNRLKIEDYYRQHPEIDDLQVEAPIIVTGLTRTGTTALGNMLSLDSHLRSLRAWEQEEPVPPPVLGQEESDPRRMRLAAEIDRKHREEPEAVAQHLFEVDASTEDTEVLGLEFGAQQMTLPVFGYFDWWRTADMHSCFAYHRRVVKLLQSMRRPNRWLFKAPHHKFHLDALVTAYPNARFIMTHRDPANVVPSYTSLVTTSVWPRGTMEHHDPKWVGPYISKHLRVGMERAIESRKRIGEDRFLDIHHHDLNQDPIGTLERVYQFLGLEFRQDMRDSVRNWITVNRSGAHGAHRYTPEQFGLTAEQIRADYDFYIKRFGVRV
jgi:hypothetical protein